MLFNVDFYKQHSALRIYTSVNRYILNNLQLINNLDERYIFSLCIYERCRAKINKEPSIRTISNYYSIKISAAAYIIDFINNIEKYKIEKIMLIMF